MCHAELSLYCKKPRIQKWNIPVKIRKVLHENLPLNHTQNFATAKQDKAAILHQSCSASTASAMPHSTICAPILAA
jgi:hypothetical protein